MITSKEIDLMIKQRLASHVKQVEVRIRPSNLVYQFLKTEENQDFIELSLDSSYKNARGSYLDFWCNYNKSIDEVNIRLVSDHKGRGLGRILVGLMEDIGKASDCSMVQLNGDANKSFWEHMEYRFNPDSRLYEKSLLSNKCQVSN